MKYDIAPLAIFGNGGFAREVYWLAKSLGIPIDAFIDLKVGQKYDLIPVMDESYFSKIKHTAIIAVGNPNLREKIASKLNGANLITLIHNTVTNMSNNHIGNGSVICANCVLTCEINIDDFAQLNLGTTIGHDVRAGKFFTTAPGVHINGNNMIGNNVYFGSNASTIEGITICDNVTIGAGACVVKDIEEPGIYVGIPARKIGG